jgi:ferric-dicitrate binding protein FerR (iron transport regulator)
VVVRTDEGLAVIRGTLVSVARTADVTCICLVEGSASVLCGGEDLGALAAGRRWVLFRDGSEPQGDEIAAVHRDHLLDLDRDHPGFGDRR